MHTAAAQPAGGIELLGKRATRRHRQGGGPAPFGQAFHRAAAYRLYAWRARASGRPPARRPCGRPARGRRAFHRPPAFRAGQAELPARFHRAAARAGTRSCWRLACLRREARAVRRPLLGAERHDGPQRSDRSCGALRAGAGHPVFGSYALTFGRGEHRHALRQQAKAAGLAIADQPALLFVAEERTSLLSGEGIILVGQLFSGTNEPLAALPPIDGSGLAGLRSAFDGFWGYFALFRATPEEWMAYRDPSGTVPIYRCGSGDNAVFVSDAAIAGRLGLLAHRRRDLRFAAHWLQFPFLQTRRSGLEEVAELLPGMAAEKAPSGSWAETLLWRPADFIRKAQAVRDPREAAGRLRDLALKVVAAQPGSSAVLLQLSGGLDSSIVAACLSQAGRTFSCVHFPTRSLDGDQRQYARDVARAFNLPLTELIEAEPAAIGSDPRPSFRPLTNPLLAPFERAVASAAELMDGTLIVDGAGGDNLFCSIPSASPVLDALRWGGSVAARTAASNIALRAGCTVWEVVAAAARRLVARRPMWKEDRTFLDPAALLRGPEVHPWLEGLEAILPAKREHVGALVHIQHFLHPRPA